MKPRLILFHNGKKISLAPFSLVFFYMGEEGRSKVVRKK